MMPTLGELLCAKDALMRRSAEVAAEAFGAADGASCVSVYVPGRVEFLGRHTDYAGGRSVVLAVDRGFRLVAVARDDEVLRVVPAAEPADARQFTLGARPPHEPGHWLNYVATVASRVHMNFSDAVRLRGADIAFVSDLPVAAGMSSSSALVVAMFLAISAVNRLDRTDRYRRQIQSRLQLAEYLGCAENGLSYGELEGKAGVGTFGGSEDHTAMLCCKPQTLSQFSYAPSVFERDIGLPDALALVIGSSGIQAVKTGEAMAKYNRASVRARKAAAAYNRAAGAECRHLRDVAVAVGADGLGRALEAIARGTESEDQDLDLPGRFEQFFQEDQQTIPAAGDAILAGNLAALGELFDASHAGAVRGLQNQIAETNFLQGSARALGVIASSAFGAGFGGSVLALVPADRADAFADAWRNSYAEKFPALARRAEFFTTAVGDSAKVTT